VRLYTRCHHRSPWSGRVAEFCVSPHHVSRTLKVQLTNASPDLVHDFRNFGEEVWSALREDYALSIEEIDASTSELTNRATQRRSIALLNAVALSPAWVHFFVRRNSMRSRNPDATPRASTGSSRELARYFRRNGYVRWQNPKRLARDGYMGYKKGDEVRLTAQDEQELQYIHELLVQAGFRPGHPFVKGQQYRLPIYGREANNKGYSGGEERVSDYAHWLNKPGR
jgi:hypothetical protein